MVDPVEAYCTEISTGRIAILIKTMVGSYSGRTVIVGLELLAIDRCILSARGDRICILLAPCVVALSLVYRKQLTNVMHFRGFRWVHLALHPR